LPPTILGVVPRSALSRGRQLGPSKPLVEKQYTYVAKNNGPLEYWVNAFAVTTVEVKRLRIER
jgi:hypothetical protein